MSTPKQELETRAKELAALLPPDLRDVYEQEAKRALYVAFSLGFAACLQKAGLPAEAVFRAFD